MELKPRVLSFSSIAVFALSAYSSSFQVLFVQKKCLEVSLSLLQSFLHQPASAMLLAAPGDLSSQTVWRRLSNSDHFLCYFSPEDLVTQMGTWRSHCSLYRKCSHCAYLDGVLEKMELKCPLSCETFANTVSSSSAALCASLCSQH